MAYYARAYYPADGDGDTVFQVPFQYISQGHVTVYYKDVSETLYEGVLLEGSDYTWTSAAVITLASPRPSTRDILIRRQTPVTVLAQQQSGIIQSSKLNLNMRQRQYVDEELFDEANDRLVDIAGLSARISALEAFVGGSTGLYVAQLSEDVPAGAFVNLFFSGGLRMRKAVATDPLKWAHGFVTAPGVTGQSLPLQASGVNALVNPPTFGEVFLSDSSPGGYSYTAPSADGSIIQSLGVALPGKGILFSSQQRISL